MKATREQLATARALKGRRIVSVKLHPFDPSNGQEAATDPVIMLDDGSILRFSVQETDVGEYGVELCVTKGSV